MDTERILFQTQWISIKESSKGFHYLERKGRDSVAVFLLRRSSIDADRYEVLIRQQPLCVDNTEINGIPRLFPCPITGAIDAGELPEQAAVREAYEEGGYTVPVKSLGQYIVSTQSNETCFLYYADVTGIEPDHPPQDGSYFESISENEWHPFEFLAKCDYSGCQIGYYRLREVLGGGKRV